MINKQLYETLDGGSLVIFENDIQVDRGIFTDIYLHLFSSVSPFWANNIFNLNIDSQTEKALYENSLDNTGKENIKRAIKSDLSKITYATFDIELTSLNDKLEIKITAKNNGTLHMVWDFTKNQNISISIQDTTTGDPLLSKSGFELLTKDGQKLTTR